MEISEKKEKVENYAAIFVALMFSCNSLSSLLNFIPGITAIIVVVSFIGFILACGKRIGNINYFFVFICLICLGFVRQVLAGNWCQTVQDCFLRLIFFGIPFLYVSFYNVDYKKLILYLMLFGIILTPVNIRDCMIEYLNFNSEDGQMTASYNILFYVVPSIIVVFGDYNNYMRILGAIEFFIGGIFLILFGSKGAILAVLVGFILVILYRKNKQIKIFSSKMIAVVLLGYMLIYNFEDILLFINDLFGEYGIESSAIPEILDKIASEDNDQLTSGRTLIYESALNQIYDRPIFGYGIAAFGGYNGTTPHNLFIHLLYEGGIVILIPYMLLLIKFVKKMNSKYQSLEIRYFLTFLLSAGLIRLLFSYNFWESQLFWFSIGIVLKDFSFRRHAASHINNCVI